MMPDLETTDRRELIAPSPSAREIAVLQEEERALTRERNAMLLAHNFEGSEG